MFFGAEKVIIILLATIIISIIGFVKKDDKKSLIATNRVYYIENFKIIKSSL
jgi:hypothetical protein